MEITQDDETCERQSHRRRHTVMEQKKIKRKVDQISNDSDCDGDMNDSTGSHHSSDTANSDTSGRNKRSRTNAPAAQSSSEAIVRKNEKNLDRNMTDSASICESSDSIDRDWLEDEFNCLEDVNGKKVKEAAKKLQRYFKSRKSLLVALKSDTIRRDLAVLEISDEIIKIIVKCDSSEEADEKEDDERVETKWIDIDNFLDLIRDKFVPEHRREAWTTEERKWLKTSVLKKAHVWDRPVSSDSIMKIIKFFLSHHSETKASLVRPMEYVLSREMEMTCFLDRNAGIIPPSQDVKEVDNSRHLGAAMLALSCSVLDSSRPSGA